MADFALSGIGLTLRSGSGSSVSIDPPLLISPPLLSLCSTGIEAARFAAESLWAAPLGEMSPERVRGAGKGWRLKVSCALVSERAMRGGENDSLCCCITGVFIICEGGEKFQFFRFCLLAIFVVDFFSLLTFFHHLLLSLMYAILANQARNMTSPMTIFHVTKSPCPGLKP